MNITLSRNSRVQISLGVLVAVGATFAGNFLNGLQEQLEEIRATQEKHSDMLEDMCLLVKISIRETPSNEELFRKVPCDLSRRNSETPPADRVVLKESP